MPEPFFNLDVNSESLLDGLEVVDEKFEQSSENIQRLEREAVRKMHGLRSLSKQTAFSVSTDVATGQTKIEWIKGNIAQTKVSLKQLEKEAQRRINKVIHVAQMGWGIIQGVIRAAGGSISMATRLVVSAGFGAIQALYPIMAAGGIAGLLSGDITKILASAAGFVQLGSAIAALVTFEMGQKDMSLQLRGLNFTMNNIGMMLSGIQL